MKGTELFTKAISEYIEREKAADELFAKCVNEQPKKTIEGCVNYILKTVKDSGINGWSDDEVFGMAKHFYDEKDLSDPGKIDARVVVNHHVELPDEEKEEAREKAKKEYLNAERKRLQDEDKKRKEREESLILSARDKEGKRLETVEVDLDKFVVNQSRGVMNKNTSAHGDIVRLVEGNMNLIKKAARRKILTK